jgi:serine/threonine protein kinase
VARKYREHNADDTSGTPGYMAPEVICRMNHSYEVDFFALGVIMYELMLGIVRKILFVETVYGGFQKRNPLKNFSSSG